MCVCVYDKASLGLDLETFHPLFIPVVLVSLITHPYDTESMISITGVWPRDFLVSMRPLQR